jgi:hypothetical protein
VIERANLGFEPPGMLHSEIDAALEYLRNTVSGDSGVAMRLSNASELIATLVAAISACAASVSKARASTGALTARTHYLNELIAWVTRKCNGAECQRRADQPDRARAQAG